VKREPLFLSGNEALAYGAYEAGVEVACAYPGTPSSEILEHLALFKEVDSQWSVNEKVAYEVALGAAIGGVRSLFACKHVGLNVAMDPLMTSSYTGIKGGLVVVVADDPGMHSSQNEQDTRWVSLYSKLPLLEPSSPKEAYTFVKEAFQISERFDTPVMLRLTTRISHTKEDIVVDKRRESENSEFSPDIAKYVMIPKNAYARHIRVEERLRELKDFSENTGLNSIAYGDRKIGFIASGVTYLYLRENYPDASYLKLGFVHPFCDDKIREFSKSVKEVFIVEELDPFLEEHIKALGIPVKAKHPSFRIGELKPDIIPDLVAGKPNNLNRPPVRKPVLCPGCAHRFVFNALKKLDIIVSGDIGCYTLAATPPLAAMHTTICMGAGITVHEGLQRSVGDKKIAGVVGDSTFIHSGITGLINAAYNGVNGLIIILDNSTTAMTGGQNHPATGKTIHGRETKQLKLEEICSACGADTVDVIDPLQYKELFDLISMRAAEENLSVIIARFPCRLMDRNSRPAPLYNEDLCRSCGLCLKIDCPAVLEREDGKISIDTSTCVGCYLCVEVCPFDALTKGGKEQEGLK
jgi:indolepyruvate ferredoxin oxidoreductase alpha subunit